jgi:hypothetical protein
VQRFNVKADNPANTKTFTTASCSTYYWLTIGTDVVFYIRFKADITLAVWAFHFNISSLVFNMELYSHSSVWLSTNTLAFLQIKESPK